MLSVFLVKDQMNRESIYKEYYDQNPLYQIGNSKIGIYKKCAVYNIVTFVVNHHNIYASFRAYFRVSKKIHIKILLRMNNYREVFLNTSNLKSSNMIGQIHSSF